MRRMNAPRVPRLAVIALLALIALATQVSTAAAAETRPRKGVASAGTASAGKTAARPTTRPATRNVTSRAGGAPTRTAASRTRTASTTRKAPTRSTTRAAATRASSKTRTATARRPATRRARTTKTPTRRSTTRAAARPFKQPAIVPEIVEPATVERGCFDELDTTAPADLHMPADRLRQILDQAGITPGLGGRPCIDYVATKGGNLGAAAAMFLRDGSDPALGGIIVQRDDETEAVVSTDLGCVVPMRREFTLPAREIDPAEELPEDVPAQVRWELAVLTRHMTRDTQGQPAPGGHHLRIVLETRDEPDMARLLALELIESPTGRVIDGVWWVDRGDGPGVLMGAGGVDYERVLWLSSVEYKRLSRGVGPALRTSVRRVRVVKNGKARTRTVRTVRAGQHLGVDFAAALGTEIHAVGQATVRFAGRASAYGNLVILDHGGGYHTYYAHMSAIAEGMEPGRSVGRGQVIGLVGSTGRSTGPHLHFEVRKDGKYMDPSDTEHQLDLWVLRPDDQARLLRQVALLDAMPNSAGLFANARCVVPDVPLASASAPLR